MLAPIPAVLVVVLVAATVLPGVLAPLIMLVPFAVGGWVFLWFMTIRRNRPSIPPDSSRGHSSGRAVQEGVGLACARGHL
jgi:hypothetical protein